MTTPKDLGTVESVNTISDSNSILVEVGGSIKRIPLDDLRDAINANDTMLLRQVAWGVPLRQDQDATNDWGVIGSTALRDEYVSLCERALVKNNGDYAPLSPTDSSVYADGTELDESKGNVMVIAPALHCRVVTDDSGLQTLWMSMQPIGGFKLANCNGGRNICLGAYIGSMSGSALVSRSGLTPAVSKTITAFWQAAQQNGTAWGLWDYTCWQWTVAMGLSLFGSPDIQTHLGKGPGGTGHSAWEKSAYLPTGGTKTLGNASGNVPITECTDGSAPASGACHTSLYGVEDIYNCLWQFVQGVYFGSSANTEQTGSEVYIYEGNRMPTSAELASHPSGHYRQSQRAVSPSEAWLKTLTLGERFDLFPVSHGGTDHTRWTDYSWQNATGQVLRVGGRSADGSRCGLVCSLSNNAFSISGSSYAARLACFGVLTRKHGREM